MEEIQLPSCDLETDIARYRKGSRESPLVSRDKQITLLNNVWKETLREAEIILGVKNSTYYLFSSSLLSRAY